MIKSGIMPEDKSVGRQWSLLRIMLRMRRFEEAVFALAGERKFAGHFHIYIGQEATGAAIISALEPRDRLATTHRNHGHMIARGANPAAALAEILGRAGGLNGGRGGTLHLCAPALGFISTSAVVGGCISLAVGAGYACRQSGNGSLAAAFFGDGALEEGVSYEAMNVASLLHLPVLFVCENNSADAWGSARGGYPSLVHAGGADLLQIPRALGIEAVRVDGTDSDAIGAAARVAIAKCRDGSGPVFIESVTRRWAGSNPLWPALVTHATDIRMATDEVPIAGEHADWYGHHDPVLRLARTLAAQGTEAVARLHFYDAEVREELRLAVAEALAYPFPEPETALTEVFAGRVS
jgi:acetoin:2,6-dichlorophenolindophenol oxidoreductase subunit alpha